MRYAYYPGCSLESTGEEYGLSAEAVCQELGVELEEIPEWNCCGASSGHCTDYRLSHALSGRNLALAGGMGLDIAVACPACFFRLKATQHETRVDNQFRETLEGLLGVPYEAKYEVRHLLDIIYNEVGIKAVKDRVTTPLAGLKVVAYYGCYLVRPPKLVHFDDAENPQLMDVLLATLGAEVLDWPGKVDCCGGSLSLVKRDIANRLAKNLVESAQGVEAEAIVTACPLCQSNLDTRQRELPVFYFTELMGLAMGMPTKAWFKRHLVNPVRLLEKHNFKVN